MCDPSRLAVIAREEAEKPYNGKWNNRVPNIQDIVALFPKWSVDEANGLWCAAFVYHCVILAGFKIPVCPKEASCSLAGCTAWEEWAQADSHIRAYFVFLITFCMKATPVSKGCIAINLFFP